MAKISENLVAIALTISLSMAFLCHMIKGIGGHEYLGIDVPAVLQFLKVGSHCEAMHDITKNISY